MARSKELQDAWDAAEKAIQEEVSKGAFCVRCGGVTTVVKYKIVMKEDSIVLKGKCKKCKHNVSRLIEDGKWF